MGDGPLDAAEEFLERVSREFREEQGRRPTLSEIVAPIELVLRHRVEEVAEGAEEVQVVGISVKVRKRPRRQDVATGDVVEIPLHDGSYAYARISPQVGFLEFFDVRSPSHLGVSTLRKTRTFRLPTTVMLDPIRDWRWRVIGQLPYHEGEFRPQLFRIAGQVACGSEVRDGFVDPTSQLRRATADEMESVPENSLWNAEMVERELGRKLSLEGGRRG